MFLETINNLSDLLTINRTIIPNIITFIVVVALIYLSFKGELGVAITIVLYTVSMSILELLGISSVFNIVTLAGSLINNIFLAVV